MRYDIKKTEKEALENQHDVRHNDIVILGTDGVHDNIFDEQILNQCIYPKIRADGELPNPEDAAICISHLAETVSYSESDETPWTIHAVAHGKDRKENLGGKPDDITVIVAQIKLH